MDETVTFNLSDKQKRSIAFCVKMFNNINNSAKGLAEDECNIPEAFKPFVKPYSDALDSYLVFLNRLDALISETKELVTVPINVLLPIVEGGAIGRKHLK